MQDVINQQLDSPDFRCGCACLSCCDWVPVTSTTNATEVPTSESYSYECYTATEDRPCSPYAQCNSYNETECGFLYSTADQVAFCEVLNPPLWPAMLQVPAMQYRAPKYPQFEPGGVPNPTVPMNDSAMLYTGDDLVKAAEFMTAMWARDVSLYDSVTASYRRAQAAGVNVTLSTAGQNVAASEESFVEATGALARGLDEFGLIMGTSASDTLTLLMEPAFIAVDSNTSATYTRSPLYFAMPNCSALSPMDIMAMQQIGEAVTNLTSLPVECVNLPPVWQANTSFVDDQLYCGWGNSNCVVRYGNKVYLAPEEVREQAAVMGTSIQQYVSGLYDWQNSSTTRGLEVSIWMNNSNIAVDPGPPYIQRWNQPVNLAANAWLKQAAGPGASATLMGIKDMPKLANKLSLDFSSLLGPLFMMWFMQLLLPVNVFMLVHEKEAGLRLMMKMQGLNDAAYYLVQYLWMVLLYCVFMTIFVIFGSLIGLKIFTLNSYSLQFVFYFLWGNLLASFSFYCSSFGAEARSAVLLAVVWVIISGFIGNLMLVQYIEIGPEWVANVMEIIPAFGLFRGLYELAQYAFLADRNGGTGLTWSKLSDPGNGMIRIWIIFALQWAAFPFLGYYIEQVTGAGTGIRKHPLFFLGWKFSNKERKSTTKASTTKETVGSSPVVDITASTPSILETPMEFYYGDAAAAAAPLTLRQKFGGCIQRKPTSVKVPMPDEIEEEADETAEDVGADVLAERMAAEALYQDWSSNPSSATPQASILLRKLRKVYPGKDGNAPKVAVAGLSLAIRRSECFGLLGPNGAGKTTTIRMMEGFMDPTAGAAIIEGLSIQDDMDSIYTLMGACPQHDLLWEGLTAREHLLFYGRLKNLKDGQELKKAVDSSLKDVNLYQVGDNIVGSYSGGMKRRLSVAIALIGDPAVVYLDEPSTGLDPASRRLLWEVVKKARKGRAIVLTTHSMEEAEALCDRLGIFVGGRLKCVGDPKELTGRFGRYLSFTITTPSAQEEKVSGFVKKLAPGAKLLYSLGGTQKYELPLSEVSVDGVFRKMEEAKFKGELEVLDWGVSNASLEEVFIKISREAGIEMTTFL